MLLIGGPAINDHTGVLFAKFALGAEPEHTSRDEEGSVGAATAGKSHKSAAEERGEAGGENSQEHDDAHDQVEEGVELEQDGPLGRVVHITPVLVQSVATTAVVPAHVGALAKRTG